jgi:hypothetical protein
MKVDVRLRDRGDGTEPGKLCTDSRMPDLPRNTFTGDFGDRLNTDLNLGRLLVNDGALLSLYVLEDFPLEEMAQLLKGNRAITSLREVLTEKGIGIWGGRSGRQE